MESKMRSWDSEQVVKKEMVDRKLFNEKISCFIDVMSSIPVPSNKFTTSELTCDNYYRDLKRKRDMESSTPLNSKRREIQLIDDQEESPIGQVACDGMSMSTDESSGHNVSMNPTGVSDELTKTHLTPQRPETSSREEQGLYSTAFNLTKAAENCGVVKRSTSLPDVCGGLECNQYSKRILTPERALRRAISMENISLSPWNLVSPSIQQSAASVSQMEASVFVKHDNTVNTGAQQDSACDSQPPADPQSAACDFQPVKANVHLQDPQGAACDFQPEKAGLLHDPQDAACDFQPEKAGLLHDPQGSACDFQPEKAGRICAILKRKKESLRKVDVSGLTLGSNASVEILNSTPVGFNSPKRRLIWSPETPRGKSSKYTIGETSNGRCAFPCDGQDVVTTTLELEALKLCDDMEEKGKEFMMKKESGKNKGKGNSPTLKTGAKTPRGRGRRCKSVKMDPRQKLIPQMIGRKAEKVKNSSPGPETQKEGRDMA